MSKAKTPDYAGRHRRFGWWSLLVFVTFGLVLETLHGFKLDAYLNLSNETRRLLWTLAHAHGTALAIVNILFGLGLERATARALQDRNGFRRRRSRRASAAPERLFSRRRELLRGRPRARHPARPARSRPADCRTVPHRARGAGAASSGAASAVGNGPQAVPWPAMSASSQSGLNAIWHAPSRPKFQSTRLGCEAAHLCQENSTSIEPYIAQDSVDIAVDTAQVSCSGGSEMMNSLRQASGRRSISRS